MDTKKFFYIKYINYKEAITSVIIFNSQMKSQRIKKIHEFYIVYKPNKKQWRNSVTFTEANEKKF